MALDVQASTSSQSLTFGQKFQKAYFLFFPEANPKNAPREVVKSRLKEVLQFDRHGVSERDVLELKTRVKKVVERYLELYPEDVYGTQLQPTVVIKYNEELKRHICSVTFRVMRVKPSLVKMAMDQEEEDFWQSEVNEQLGEYASTNMFPQSDSPSEGKTVMQQTGYDNGETWEWYDDLAPDKARR
eukprot:CAMPEP_0118951756 /NCGR_PEP_ID=MMETSP1169-20130426/53681_1 /TAXON_ID=36882 /ORGANISM="Pyramimonas obovata, Strain CCMP722" /LENGTH=185 /DNA_ID=CAMNT_0006898885 /DNA_START=32 /DNA_END=589 /DNA_ORIENTATION=-